MDKKKLKPLYEFLIRNREFNKKVQSNYYRSIISHQEQSSDKVISLLYNIANTQSQPRIDNLARFYKSVFNDINSTKSFAAFVKKVSGKDSNLYFDLFLGLRKQDGWGDKTAALFVKSVYHAHNGNYDESFSFWCDAPKTIVKKDKLKLPVDVVISRIFKEIGFSKTTFSKINSILSDNYNGDKIEVWDDLWFWGFITQKGSGTDRSIEWNENKYWSLEDTDKNESEIIKIKDEANEFINLLASVKSKI